MTASGSARRHSFRSAIARAIVRRYPPAWRRRYEDEMIALIEDSGSGWRQLADLARGAVREWVDPSLGCDPRHGRKSFARGRWLFIVVEAYAIVCATRAALTMVEWLARAAWAYHSLGALRDQMTWTFTGPAFVVTAVLLTYSLAWSAPVAVGLLAARAGRRWPLTSRFVWLLAFEGFALWIGIYPFAWRQEGFISLSAGGWVIARALFPLRET